MSAIFQQPLYSTSAYMNNAQFSFPSSQAPRKMLSEGVTQDFLRDKSLPYDSQYGSGGWDGSPYHTKPSNFVNGQTLGKMTTVLGRAASEKGEVVEVEGVSCEVPSELFDLRDLSDILCLETWNDVLTDDDREYLAQFLPPVEGEDMQEALEDLLGGFNVFFGNPRVTLSRWLRSGQCNTKVLSYKKGLRILQRKQHYHMLRQYHNKMVNQLLDMKKVWHMHPDAYLEQKLKHWQNMSSDVVPKGKSQIAVPASGKSSGRSSPLDGNEHVSSFPGKMVTKDHHQARQSAGGSPAQRIDAVHGLERKLTSRTSADQAFSQRNLSHPQGDGFGRPGRHVIGQENLLGLKRKRDVNGEGGSAGNEDHPEGGMLPQQSGTPELEDPDVRDSKTITTMFPSPTGRGFTHEVRQLHYPGGYRERDSFSLLYLLSAVRSVLLQMRSPESEESGWCTLSEIVECIQTLPADAKTLKSQPSLPDFVRQALSVLQTKAPPGTRLWKPFVQQKKQNKELLWSWCGIVPIEDEDFSFVHDEPEYWGVIEKALVKLQERLLDSLREAAKLKASSTPVVKAERVVVGSVQSKRSGSGSDFRTGEVGSRKEARTPSPAVLHGDVKNEPEAEWRGPIKEGDPKVLKDVKGMAIAQRNQITLPEIHPEMVEQFREEEARRFSLPQEAFAYTAVDGGMSMVAPVQRVNGKAVGKARDHVILVAERPAYATILALVRDACARLPNGVGTRADVCLLLRDSQYLVEETSDTQLHQIVSGAMDRLHHERDPCVRFFPDRKLWQYLHRDRSADDFEDDGTLSTRHWGKRKSPDASEELMGEEGREESPYSSSPFNEL